jgi:glycosyltransferase involved in cell wall biosynthesis
MNTTRPLVSIIIPTYNRQSAVVDAIESCSSQDWPAVETIVIDDGSTDHTASVIQNIIKESCSELSLRYYHQENSGASSARNFGLRQAKGEFIQFLDSDDVLLPEKLSRQVNAIAATNNPNTSFCSCYGEILSKDQSNRTRIGTVATKKREMMLRLVSREPHTMQTNAPLWRRTFLLAQPPWCEEIGLGDDLEYYLRLVAASSHFCFVPESLFYLRTHQAYRLGETTQTNASITSAIHTLASIHETLSNEGLWDESFQRELLRTTRTTYANVLTRGTDKQLQQLEAHLVLWSQSPNWAPLYLFLVFLRKLLGRGFILSLQHLLSKDRSA